MTPHIRFDPDKHTLYLVDQRLLPAKLSEVECRKVEDVIEAIKQMVVRGAPAIGVTAAFGCVISLITLPPVENWRELLEKQLNKLRNARPTAVNLAWAIDRMRQIIPAASTREELGWLWLIEARKIQEEDIAICKRLGFIGAELLKDGATVLTHCNAGALATAGHGTALGVIRSAIEAGKKIKVIADETRPFLQGSRLTAYELKEDGIPVTLACDNACALLMSKGLVDMVMTGADRIAANGDTANKIGTLGVAILARHYQIPFYIAAPLSTFDLSLHDGSSIPIEQRPEQEVLKLGGLPIAPEGVAAYNFAFDITPASLITGIITEAGIINDPCEQSIARIITPAHA